MMIAAQATTKAVEVVTNFGLKEIAIIIGFLTIFASIVTTWAINKKKISDLEKDVEKFDEHRKGCSALQSKRYSELKDTIGKVHVGLAELHGKIKTVDTKLDTIISLNNSNGSKGKENS